ncbi:MAG: hypothetical protein WBV70_03060 [Candidatus Bathyarchaeia archaeon]
MPKALTRPFKLDRAWIVTLLRQKCRELYYDLPKHGVQQHSNGTKTEAEEPANDRESHMRASEWLQLLLGENCNYTTT